MMVGRTLRLAAALAVVMLPGLVPLAAQQATLVGRLMDSTASAPLADVHVSAAGRTARTDRDGRYRLEALPVGSVEIAFRRIGYAQRTERVVLVAGSNTLDLRLAPIAAQLTTVVVTATRDARSLVDVPVPVSVADSTTLQHGRTAGLHEVLRLAPGVQATSRFGLDDVNLSIRGSGVRTTFGVRGVAVVMDGVPVTEPDGQTRLDILELGAAKQVEVVRGPASALYGGTAAGGVVNVISRTPAESRGISARVSTGSFGFRKYGGSFGSATADGRLGVALSGTWTESDGFRAHNTNLMKRLNLRGEWKPSARTTVNLEASTSDLDMTIPGALTRGEFDANPFGAEPVTVTNNYGRRDARWRAGLKLAQEVALAGRDATVEAYGFYGGRELDHPIFQVVDQSFHRVQTGAQTVGQLNDVPNLGVYGQLEGRIEPTLGLTVGGRWDRVEYGVTDLLTPAKSAAPAFTQFSPKATLSWTIAREGSLYASVARGFDVPTLGEITASADPTLGFNPDLGPKRLWNYELGIKGLVGKRLFLDASVYRQQITGELLPRNAQVGNQTVTVFDNAGRSRHWGAELAATAWLHPNVDLGASYTWSDFVLTDFVGTVTGANGASVRTDFAGNRLPGVPVHRVAAELRVRPAEGLQLGITAEWQDRMFVDNANTERGTLFVRGFGPNPAISQVPFGQVDA